MPYCAARFRESIRRGLLFKLRFEFGIILFRSHALERDGMVQILRNHFHCYFGGCGSGDVIHARSAALDSACSTLASKASRSYPTGNFGTAARPALIAIFKKTPGRLGFSKAERCRNWNQTKAPPLAT